MSRIKNAWLLAGTALATVLLAASACTSKPGANPDADTILAKDLKGLTIEFNSAHFEYMGTSGKQGIAVEYRLINNTDKPLDKFQIQANVTYDSLPDKLTGTVQDWEILPYGGDLKGVLPPGQFCYTPFHVLEITPEQWRLDYHVTAQIIAARKFDPKAHPDDPRAWQVTAVSGTPDDTLAVLRAHPDLRDTRNDNGFGLMALAVFGGNVETVKALEKEGLDYSDVLPDGRNLLHLAAYSKGPMVAHVLSKKVESAVDSYGNYPISYAIYDDNKETLDALLAGGADVNLANSNGENAFMVAVAANRPDLIKALGGRVADPDQLNNDEKNAIAMAATGWWEVLDDVYQFDKNVNRQSPTSGMTPLHYVVKTGTSRAATWLVAHGADPKIKDNKGKTPMDYVDGVPNAMDRMRMQFALEGR